MGKGGASKSTVAFCLGLMLQHKGKTVELLDNDPQQSLARFKASTEFTDDPDPEFRIEDTAGRGDKGTLVDALKKQKRGVDLVIIPMNLTIDEIYEANRIRETASTIIEPDQIGVVGARLKGGNSSLVRGEYGQVVTAMNSKSYGAWMHRTAYVKVQHEGFHALRRDNRALKEVGFTVDAIIKLKAQRKVSNTKR